MLDQGEPRADDQHPERPDRMLGWRTGRNGRDSLRCVVPDCAGRLTSRLSWRPPSPAVVSCAEMSEAARCRPRACRSNAAYRVHSLRQLLGVLSAKSHAPLRNKRQQTAFSLNDSRKECDCFGGGFENRSPNIPSPLTIFCCAPTKGMES